MNEKNVGFLIRNARENLGLSSAELAEICGMTPQHLLKIEEGKVAKPHVKTIKTLADYLDLDFHQLMEICGYLKPDLPEKTLAEVVKNARLSKGYTQEELATMSEVSKETISHIERGVRTKNCLETLKKLAICLELDFQYLKEICGYADPQ